MKCSGNQLAQPRSFGRMDGRLPENAGSGKEYPVLRSMGIPAWQSRRCSLLLCYIVGSCAFSWLTFAAVTPTGNPYDAIVSRNVFGLKPPAPPAPPPPPAAAAPTIKLLGITTILGRAQVMLKVSTAARPPEPAKEQSYLMREGQGEDDIEVMEIDALAGTVKLKNRDLVQSLSMKEDSLSPTPGATLPATAVPPPPASPLIPGRPAPAAAPAIPVNTGGSAASRTLPTRSLRTSSASNLTPQQQMAAQRTPEETAALYEINRAKNELLRQSGIPVPNLPQHPMFRGAQ